MRVLIGVVLIVIGVLGVVAGVLYLTQPAHALPSFFPGYVAHANGKLLKHGIAAVVVGGVVAIVGLVVALSGGRRRRW
jgi:multisubunit Na+/H+ antiporter MnhB subunit